MLPERAAPQRQHQLRPHPLENLDVEMAGQLIRGAGLADERSGSAARRHPHRLPSSFAGALGEFWRWPYLTVVWSSELIEVLWRCVCVRGISTYGRCHSPPVCTTGTLLTALSMPATPDSAHRTPPAGHRRATGRGPAGHQELGCQGTRRHWGRAARPDQPGLCGTELGDGHRETVSAAGFALAHRAAQRMQDHQHPCSGEVELAARTSPPHRSR